MHDNSLKSLRIASLIHFKCITTSKMMHCSEVFCLKRRKIMKNVAISCNIITIKEKALRLWKEYVLIEKVLRVNDSHNFVPIILISDFQIGVVKRKKFRYCQKCDAHILIHKSVAQTLKKLMKFFRKSSYR